MDSVAFNKQYSCCKFFSYGNTKNKLSACFRETCKTLLTNMFEVGRVKFKKINSGTILRDSLVIQAQFPGETRLKQAFLSFLQYIVFPEIHLSSIPQDKQVTKHFQLQRKSNSRHSIYSQKQRFTLNTHQLPPGIQQQ